MYYVVEIATTASGTAKQITLKESDREAEMLFHQVLASMMANNNLIHGICTVLTESGRQFQDLTREVIGVVSQEAE